MGILCVFCVYDTIGNRCFEKTSFPKTGDVVVSHRHATIANALIKTWSATTTFPIFNDDRVPQNILISIAKKCNFAIKNDTLTVENAVLRFLLRIWDQDCRAMYEPTQ